MDQDSASALKIGQKKITGILQKCGENEIEISSTSTSDDGSIKILISDIKKATVHRVFKI